MSFSKNNNKFVLVNLRVWFSGRTTGCQSVDGSSILPTRTKIICPLFLS